MKDFMFSVFGFSVSFWTVIHTWDGVSVSIAREVHLRVAALVLRVVSLEDSSGCSRRGETEKGVIGEMHFESWGRIY